MAAMPTFWHRILFLGHKSAIFYQFHDEKYAVSTNTAHSSVVLDMLKKLNIFCAKNGRDCPVGTEGHSESGTPPKVCSLALLSQLLSRNQ